MTALQTIAVAFAMFSALPMPQFDWNEKNMRYALCAFPLVGVVCGALWCLCGVPAAACGWPARRGSALCRSGSRAASIWTATPTPATPFRATAIPRKEAGNFKGPPLRRVRGHPAVQLLCGVFCAVRLCGSSPRGSACCWTLALVRERALSGLAVAAFPLAKNTGLAHTFATAADRRPSCGSVLAVLCAMLAVALTALGGWALVLAAVLRFCAVLRCCQKAVWRHHRRSGRVVFAEMPSSGCWRRWPPANGWGCCK